jgi:hypothetical protein
MRQCPGRWLVGVMLRTVGSGHRLVRGTATRPRCRPRLGKAVDGPPGRTAFPLAGEVDAVWTPKDDAAVQWAAPGRTAGPGRRSVHAPTRPLCRTKQGRLRIVSWPPSPCGVIDAVAVLPDDDGVRLAMTNAATARRRGRVQAPPRAPAVPDALGLRLPDGRGGRGRRQRLRVGTEKLQPFGCSPDDAGRRGDAAAAPGAPGVAWARTPLGRQGCNQRAAISCPNACAPSSRASQRVGPPPAPRPAPAAHADSRPGRRRPITVSG